MRNLLRRLKWFVLITCIVFSHVASSAITAKSWGSEVIVQTQEVTPCRLTGTLRKLCPPASQPIPFIPKASPQPSYIDGKTRFLNAIATRLNPSPQPGSYEYLVLREYGGIFATTNPQIQLPHQVAFNTAAETKAFQSTLNLGRVDTGRNCLLQKPAADAFNIAQKATRIRLRSGNGSSDCLRSFETTKRFWYKYADSKTLQKVRRGQPHRIMRVVAPPGSSQHLWGLALDLGRLNSRQTKALNQNGWFQTVKEDRPHWTYLGMEEAELVQLGFKKQKIGRNIYWLTPV